jgi:hypothetical protein
MCVRAYGINDISTCIVFVYAYRLLLLLVLLLAVLPSGTVTIRYSYQCPARTQKDWLCALIKTSRWSRINLLVQHAAHCTAVPSRQRRDTTSNNVRKCKFSTW